MKRNLEKSLEEWADPEALEEEITRDYVHNCRGDLFQAYRDAKRLKEEGANGESARRLSRFAARLTRSGEAHGFGHLSFEGTYLKRLLGTAASGSGSVDSEVMGRIYASLECIKDTLRR